MMSTIFERESRRLSEQERLDGLKSPRERNKLGQFATPPALALDIAKFVWHRVKNRKTQFSFFDPAVGTGSFFAAFLQAFPPERVKAAVGIEIDAAFADTAKRIWSGHGL